MSVRSVNIPKAQRLLALASLIVGAVFILALPAFGGGYWVYVVQLVGINVVLALGLNIFFGFCGQINLASAAFYAMGAYSYVLLQQKLGIPFLLALPLTLAFCALVTLLLSEVLLRLRHFTLALGSIAIGLTVYLVADRWYELTGGGDGVSMPASSLFGIELGDKFAYYMILVVAVVCYLIAHFLAPSKIGRAMKAIRDDETAALAMGINVHGTMRLAFLLNGMFCGVAGILTAQQNQWISPSVFNVWVNILVVVMVIVGGLGSNPGVVIGAAVVTILPLQFSGLAEYSGLAFGVIVFLVVLFMPQGIIGLREAIPSLLSRINSRLSLGRVSTTPGESGED